MAMPSIGASFANSQANKSGGQVTFAPSHAMGAARTSSTFSGNYSDEQSSEATAKTDMGGGLFGGGGGDGGSGLGLGGLVSGIAGALGLGGKKPGGTVASGAAGFADSASGGGPNWGLIILLGGCAVGVAILLFGFMRKA